MRTPLPLPLLPLFLVFLSFSVFFFLTCAMFISFFEGRDDATLGFGTVATVILVATTSFPRQSICFLSILILSSISLFLVLATVAVPSHCDSLFSTLFPIRT